MLGVLLMSYGSPNALDEVEAYYTDIRHGKKPTPEEVANLRERYRAIGGRSPLLEITRRQAGLLEEKLREDGLESRVFVGMKHWHPYIAEAVQEIADERIERLIVVALAPHYSKISIGGYHEAVLKALAAHPEIHLDFVEDWHLHPELLNAWKGLIETGLSEFGGRENVYVIFTAHSLPERILQEGDPYKRELLETSAKLAEVLSLKKWGFAFQSAGHTQEPWLGPDISEALVELKKEGKSFVLAVPIGFVADHLEILYDLDVEASQKAAQLGIEFKRTRLPNTSPVFITALASLIKARSRLEQATTD